MAVDFQHKDYRARVEQWKRARDVMAGRDAILTAGQDYLPKLADQSPEEYAKYAKRAKWYGASWRTVQGLVGMMFRKAPELVVPEEIKPYLEDIDMAGTPIHQFLKDASTEALGMGRVGLLVDYPKKPAGEITLAEAEQGGLRPKIVSYKTESIINWRKRRVKNKTVLSLVVLCEMAAKINPENIWEEQYEKRWRVLDLDDRNFYRVRMFKKNDRGEDEQIGPDEYPLMDGQKMEYIPFYPVSPDGLDIVPYEPSLLDLFDLNLHHWRVSADYEHGCHFTGLPTPWIAGYSPAQNEKGEITEKLMVGSTAAWTFPDPQAKAGYLEFTGQGLSALKANLEHTEAQMAVLGARMLAPEKKQVETATTSNIQKNGETSALADLALSLSQAVTAALKTFVQWAGKPVDKVKAEINREFMPSTMDPSMIAALVSAWQSQAIDFDTMIWNFKRGDLVRETDTAEDIQAAIDAAPPPAPEPATGEPLTKPTGKDPQDVVK